MKSEAAHIRAGRQGFGHTMPFSSVHFGSVHFGSVCVDGVHFGVVRIGTALFDMRYILRSAQQSSSFFKHYISFLASKLGTLEVCTKEISEVIHVPRRS